jgi:uncharacterized protein (TIGR02266 family)
MLRSPIIVLKVSQESAREHLFGYAKNISRGGLFISSINPRTPGERFTISFRVPGTPINALCQCEVVWMRRFKKKMKLEPGYGIRFLDLPEDVAQAIDHWVTTQT